MSLPRLDTRAVAGIGGVILGYLLAAAVVSVLQLFEWLPL